MKLLINLGIFVTLIIFLTFDDCSSIITESSYIGSCQWTTRKEATCTTSSSCSLNSESTGCEPEEGCSFTSAVKTEPTCTAKCASSDNSDKCAAAGCTYDTEKTTFSVPTCAVNTNGDASDTSSEGCEFTASTVTTPPSCTATTTWQLNSNKTACETSDGCKFTDATAGNCAEKSSNNANILKMSLLSLLLFLFLF